MGGVNRVICDRGNQQGRRPPRLPGERALRMGEKRTSDKKAGDPPPVNKYGPVLQRTPPSLLLMSSRPTAR